MKKLITILWIMFLIGCSSQSKVNEKYANLVGKKYSSEIYTQLGGEVETLSGTDNQKWIAYFPKADITIIEDKKTWKIISVMKGRVEQ